MAHGFLCKIKEFIDRNHLLDDGAHVIVGLSGGADSTALLIAMLRLGYHPHAVHCNFHLRGTESDRDQEFVTALCKQLNVELTICSYDTRRYATEHGLSIEMAARELRYADFNSIMQECGASAVCIAHHRDDSIETILINLIRGTGIKGLTGIKPRNGNIIRPMLCVSRSEIEAYLQETGQTYVTDSTNLETVFTRNKIRLQLLPLMRTLNPDVDTAIADTAVHIEQAYNIYRDALERLSSQIIKGTGDSFSIDIHELEKTPSPKAFLFETLSSLGFYSSQIDSIAASVNSRPGTRFISPTHQLVKDRDAFIVSPSGPGTTAVSISVTPEPGTTVSLPDGRKLKISSTPAGAPIPADPLIATFDAKMIGKGDLTIRRWHDGDWFIPFGMKGRKLVSDYLTDCKVSYPERESQLVVTHGEDIIWVLGRRTDNRYRVTSHTTNNLELKIEN